MTQVTIQEAENQLPRLIRIAHQGGEVIITSDSKPVARLISIPEESLQKPRAQFGSGRGIFRMEPGFDEPLEDFKEYME